MVLDFERFVEPVDPIDAGDLGLLLDWKRSYGDERLGRWRRVEIEQFLLDWCPAKLSATAQQVQSLPAAVALAIRGAATTVWTQERLAVHDRRRARRG